MNLKTYLENINDEKNIKTKMNVAAAVIMKKGENGEQLVLMIQRAADDHWPLHWEIPRGKCDDGPNEKLSHCLKREIKEETGLDIIPTKFIDKFSYLADNGTRQSIQYNFLCRLKDPNQKVKLSNEHQEYKWVSSVGEVELLALPEIKKTISKVLDTDEKIVEYPDNDFTPDEKIKEALTKFLGD